MHSDLLNSWKEIAVYLGRGVRTVQRWEVELHLPVRRPHEKKRSAIIAFKSDLDQWVRHSGRATNGSVVPFTHVAATTSDLKTNRQKMRALSARLRAQVERTQELLLEACELASHKASRFDKARLEKVERMPVAYRPVVSQPHPRSGLAKMAM